MCRCTGNKRLFVVYMPGGPGDIVAAKPALRCLHNMYQERFFLWLTMPQWDGCA